MTINGASTQSQLLTEMAIIFNTQGLKHAQLSHKSLEGNIHTTYQVLSMDYLV